MTLVIAAAALPLHAQQPSAQPVAAAKGRSIDPSNIDTTCAACTDFFQFANGGWIKRSTIPAAYTSWGSFNELADKNQEVTHQILEEARADTKAKPGTNVYKIGAFYGSCMDSTHIEAEGSKPLKPYLAMVNAIKTRADLVRSLGTIERKAGLVPFFMVAGQDPKSSTDVIAISGQGGLGMPERDYYTRTDSSSVRIRAAYVAHIVRSLQLAGESAAQAQSDADKAMAIETQLANASMTLIQQRDPNATYNKMTVAEMQTLAPTINWSKYLKEIGANGVTVIDVRQPAFFKAYDAMLTSVPVEDWKAYMRWHVVNNSSGALSSAFVNENFTYSSMLSGARAQQPRWKRCAAATNGVLGEAIGQEYVKRTFTPEAKAHALEMVNNLRDALKSRISALEWMSDTTKQRALVKLDAFTRKIGYPDKWRDYSALDVKPGAYLDNLNKARDFSAARNWAKVGKPVDRTEWGMTPPTVNAYYNPAMNEIVFPAGILQPPFYDPNADDAVNYGGMGAVIGHEMTHGFDDQGRQYDAQGNLRDWWTAQDAEKYKARATLISDQFDRYTVVDTMTHVKGKQTLGENIADLGGLTIAYAAMQKAMEGKPRPANIDGFSPEQRFFLSWAQVWRSIQRPESERLLVNTDVHAPGKWRVNGPLSNMPEFAKAWGCKHTDAMVRGESLRAQIW